MTLTKCCCALLAGLVLLCSQTVGGAQLPKDSKENGGSLGSKTPKVAPAHRTGFSAVAPYLNADGAMLSFYDTRELVAGGEAIVSLINNAILQSARQDEGAKLGAKIISLIYESSGVKALAAVGSSSVPRGNELHFNRKYIARATGDHKPGFLWNALTEKTGPLTGLDLLPATTAWAAFGNVNFAYLDSLVAQISGEAGGAEAMKNFKQKLEAVGVKWEEVLASLDDEVGVVLLLDPKRSIRVPAGQSVLKLPHPSGGVILRTKNNYIYERISKLGGPNGPQEEEIQGCKLLSQAVSNPVVPDLAPTIALVDKYLVLGSSRDFPLQVAATLRGKTPGVRGSAEFKSLSQDVPLEGSAFSFSSKVFSDTIRQLVDEALSAVPGNAQREMLKQTYMAFLAGMAPQPSFTVLQRVDADWLVTSNGPQDIPLGVTTNAATIGMLGGIAVPNFLRARARSQATQILEDARTLDAAVDQYAIENNLQPGSPVSFKDVAPYLNKNSRLAQSGGKDVFGRAFIIKPVDQGIRIHPETIQQVDKQVVSPDFFKPYAD